ncbi:MAG: hypothetical protein ACYTGH_20255, partial [Planctomycetota bacterium]
GEGLLEARYALLTRALQLYCEIGLEDIEEDIDEIDLSEYRIWYDSTTPEIKPLQETLRKQRALLYLDFPEELLTSVSDATILQSRSVFKMDDSILKSKQGKAVAEEIQEAQDRLLRTLREIMSKARGAIEKQEARAEVYLSLVSNIKVLKHMLESHIGPEEASQMEKQLLAFEEHIRKFFAADNYIPAEVLRDVGLHHAIFGDGNPHI